MSSQDFSDAFAQLEQGKDLVRQLGNIFTSLTADMKQQINEVGSTAQKNYNSLNNFVGRINSFKDIVQTDLSNAFKNAIRNGNGFADVFTKLGSSLEDMVVQLGIVNPLLNQLFGGNKGTLGDVTQITSGNFSGNGGLLGSLFGGLFGLFEGRAGGGPVNAGIPYMVGERGPEMFVPQVAGRIGQTGGAPVSVTFNISTPDADSFRASQAQIAASMLDSVRRAQRIR